MGFPPAMSPPRQHVYLRESFEERRYEYLLDRRYQVRQTKDFSKIPTIVNSNRMNIGQSSAKDQGHSLEPRDCLQATVHTIYHYQGQLQCWLRIQFPSAVGSQGMMTRAARYHNEDIYEIPVEAECSYGMLDKGSHEKDR